VKPDAVNAQLTAMGPGLSVRWEDNLFVVADASYDDGQLTLWALDPEDRTLGAEVSKVSADGDGLSFDCPGLVFLGVYPLPDTVGDEVRGQAATTRSMGRLDPFSTHDEGDEQ
jgi:hypothetical protein